MPNILDLLADLKNLYPEYEWTLPSDISHGLFTTNQAFKEAKIQKTNPAQLATNLATDIQKQATNLNLEVTTIGPYINLKPTTKLLEKYLTTGENLDLKKVDQTFVIDMFHPNVGKKMHVGHIRSGDLGEAMRRILQLKYSKVISDCYLGDWGIQFSYTSWGILNLNQLNLDFDTIDVDNEPYPELIDKFYKIYVRMNQLIEEKPEIKLECQKNSKLLETGLQNQISDQADQEKFNFLHNLYQRIVEISLTQFKEAEKYLNLNHNPGFINQPENLIEIDIINRVKGKTGTHQANPSHSEGVFNLTLGESFYISFISEFEYFVEAGLAQKEGNAIYVDLEDEKLGRCYLISSEGYSLYHSRDIICRLVYAGIFGFDRAISFADNRQAHSFKQVFAVLKKIIDSGVYKNKPFGWMTQAETDQAMDKLSKNMAEFQGFGHFELPDGAMSTRKGRIFEFTKLRSELTQKVEATLRAKQGTINQDKIEKIAVATLKWADFYRDREQDVVFDLDQFTSFEGNTGVYQLYTLARLNSILIKNDFDLQDGECDITALNSEEMNILTKAYTLPTILDRVTEIYKPHLLCTHLFELATMVNSWYAKNSVTNEDNNLRKQTLLHFCNKLKTHIWISLELLGIEPLEEL